MEDRCRELQVKPEDLHDRAIARPQREEHVNDDERHDDAPEEDRRSRLHERRMRERALRCRRGVGSGHSHQRLAPTARKRNGCGMWRLLRVLLLLGVMSCRTKTLEPLALDIGVTANKTTVATGEAVSFVVTAQGGGLVAIGMNYGDTNVEQFSAGGARTARITFSHAYGTVGTYQVRATVTDVEAGEKSVSMDIVVH